jgi:molybdate transport system substrate-binding protein
MSVSRRTILTGLATVLIVRPSAAQARPLVIFAAASLKNALDSAAQAWSQGAGVGTGVGVGKPAPKISYAASNTLAKQIEQGAPADVFFSADTDWMGYLEEKKLIRAGSRVDLLGNRIVLIAPKSSSVALALQPGVDLAPALGKDGRIAMGNTDAVPAGKYGKAALEHLGAWAGIRNRLAQAESVRAALALVARGEAPLGIVYATDAAAEPGVRVVATFPAESHPPIIFPLAILRESTHSDAPGLLAFLRGEAAKALFEAQGFTLLNRAVGPA